VQVPYAGPGQNIARVATFPGNVERAAYIRYDQNSNITSPPAEPTWFWTMSYPLIRYGVSEVLGLYEADPIPAVNNLQNFPNPVRDMTTFAFTLDQPINNLQMEIYDVMGKLVQRIALGSLTAGEHQVTYDAGKLASGIYEYSLTNGVERLTKSMIVSK